MASGRAFTVAMNDQTIVADATLVLIHAAAALSTAGSLLEVIEATAGQKGVATSNQLSLAIGRKVSAFGTYTSTTPQPNVLGSAASAIAGGTAGAAATAGTDASAEGGGAFTAHKPLVFNNLNGYLWIPTPEDRLIIGPDQAVALKIIGTPANLLNWSASITFLQLA